MQVTPEQRRKNAARRSRRTLSAAQIAALREIGSHSKARNFFDVKRALTDLPHYAGYRHLNIRLTLAALKRKGLIEFDGEDARITPVGKALLLRGVK